MIAAFSTFNCGSVKYWTPLVVRLDHGNHCGHTNPKASNARLLVF